MQWSPLSSKVSYYQEIRHHSSAKILKRPSPPDLGVFLVPDSIYQSGFHRIRIIQGIEKTVYQEGCFLVVPFPAWKAVGAQAEGKRSREFSLLWTRLPL